MTAVLWSVRAAIVAVFVLLALGLWVAVGVVVARVLFGARDSRRVRDRDD